MAGTPIPEQTKTEQLAALDAMQKDARAAQLLLIPVPAVKKLVEAATVGGACTTAK